MKYCKIFVSSESKRKVFRSKLFDPESGRAKSIEEGLGCPLNVFSIEDKKEYGIPDLLILEDDHLTITTLLDQLAIWKDQLAVDSIVVLTANNVLQAFLDSTKLNPENPKFISFDFNIGEYEQAEKPDTELAKKNYTQLKKRFPETIIAGVTNYALNDLAQDLVAQFRKNGDSILEKSRAVWQVFPQIILDKLEMQRLINELNNQIAELKHGNSMRDESIISAYFDGIEISPERIREVRINGETPEEILGNYGFGGGESLVMKCMFYEIKNALDEKKILVTGESGSGKEKVAQIIHNYSGRKGDLISIPAGQLSSSDDTILLQKLFGIEEGAASGVKGDLGYFRKADPGGTVFIDEIQDISEQAQDMLMRFLQDWSWQSATGRKFGKIKDVKLIFATNGNLTEKLRHDFVNRLPFYSIKVPSVKDLDSNAFGSSILAIMNQINSEMIQANPQYSSKGISPKAIKYLYALDFSNTNFRKLEGILSRAAKFCEGDTIEIKHIPRAQSQNNFSEEKLDKRIGELSLWINWIQKQKGTFTVEKLATTFGKKGPAISQILKENKPEIKEIILRKKFSESEIQQLLRLSSFKKLFQELCETIY